MMGYLASTALYDEVSLRKAVVYGAVLASFNVTDFGPKKLSDLTFTEIEARYREFCKMTIYEEFDKTAAYSFNLLQ